MTANIFAQAILQDLQSCDSSRSGLYLKAVPKIDQVEGIRQLSGSAANQLSHSTAYFELCLGYR